MKPILPNLQNKQWVWTAANAKQETPATRITTGFKDLDQVLTGGFPKAGMIHLHSPLGCGEVRFMLSILRHHQQNNKAQKLCVFINPPFDLNAEFLLEQHVSLAQLVIVKPTKIEDALWSAEQCAKSGACHSIFMWHNKLKHVQVRKLEYAAIQGDCYCIWMDASNIHCNHTLQKNARDYECNAQQNLPLSLSLQISREDEKLHIKVNKQKLGWAQKTIKVPLPFITQSNRMLKSRHMHRLVSNKIVSIHSNK